MCRKKLPIRQQYLTEREAEILLYCSLGFSIDETAERLFSSPKTIQKHRENIRERFELTNKGHTALWLFALEMKQELEEFLEKCKKQ